MDFKLIISFSILLFTAMFLNGCPVIDPRMEVIKVHNETNRPIHIYDTCSDFLPKSPELALFQSFKLDDEIVEVPSPSYIPPDTMISALTYPSIKSFFNSCEERRVYFYFITEETMKENSWDKIYREQLFEDRVSYFYEELEELNWVVKYK